MKKLLTVLFLSLVLFSLASVEVLAAEAKSLDSLDLDLTIIQNDDENYGSPEKIVVVPISLNLETKRLTSGKWIKGLFYYTIDRLGFQDIPFHYLVTSNGEVFNGNSSGDEKKIFIDGVGHKAVVVGYISNTASNMIDPAAQEALGDLLITIANRDIIKPNNVGITGVKFIKDDEKNTVTMKAEEVSDSWRTSFKSIAQRVQKNYSPISKGYNIEVVEVVLPEEKITPGENVTVSIKLKNVGKYGLYQDSNSEIILSKEGSGASNFYINNQWLSQTQTTLMSEGQSLLPGKEFQFDISIRAPLSKGTYAETFILRTFEGSKIKAADIKLSLKLVETDNQIIEIKPNNLGYVNVKASTTSSKVLRKVTAGERFFLLEVNNETFWAKIDLGGGEEGWLAIWNFKYI